MTTKKLIKQHKKKIEILEAIRHFENAIKLKTGSINGYPGTFPELRRKYIHNIEIYNKCIQRLTERYSKVTL